MKNSFLIKSSCGHNYRIITIDNISLWTKIIKLQQDYAINNKNCIYVAFDTYIKKNDIKNMLCGTTNSINTKEFVSFKYMAKNNDKEFVLFQLLIHSNNSSFIGLHYSSKKYISFLSNQDRYIFYITIMQFSLYPFFFQNQKTGGITLHAALIEYKNKGVLLVASGGTGKTTSCCRLPSSWSVLCDDEVLIVHDRNNKKYNAHPLPTWSSLRLQQRDGKKQYHKRNWDIEQFNTVNAIFFLEQGMEDKVVPIGKGEAAMKIYLSYEQAVRLRDARTSDKEAKNSMMKEAFNNACNLAKSVPTFILRTTLTGQFWKEIENELQVI